MLRRLISCACCVMLLAACWGLFRTGIQQRTEAAPQAEPSGSNVRDHGAVGDGQADDTAAIEAALAAGDAHVHLPKGVYRLTRPLEIELAEDGFFSITGDGTARLLMDGPGPAIRIIGTHEGTAGPGSFEESVWQQERAPVVRGIEIVGAHDEADGIEAVRTMQLTVSQVVMRRLRHAIHLVDRNRNVIISDCHLYENRGAGVFYDDVNLHQSNIVGSHISYNGAGGVVIKAGNVRNVHISGCDIEGNMAADGPPTANILIDCRGGSIGEVAITGCTIQHTHDAPQSANVRMIGPCEPVPFTDELRHGNITIASNVMSDAQFNIDVDQMRGFVITGNTFWMGYENSLRIRRSRSFIVGDNLFDRNPRYGYGRGDTSISTVVFEDCYGGTVIGNHFDGIANAVAFRKCERMNIAGLTVLNAAGTGVLLEEVTGSRLSGSMITADPEDASAVALRVTGGSGNVIAEDNLIQGKRHP